jgi:hypothetical protein
MKAARILISLLILASLPACTSHDQEAHAVDHIWLTEDSESPADFDGLVKAVRENPSYRDKVTIVYAGHLHYARPEEMLIQPQKENCK